MPNKSYINTLVRFYSSEQQQQVFQNYLTESKRVRLIFIAHKYLNKIGLGYLPLALQGLRSTAQFFPVRPLEGELIALALEPNQERNIRHIVSLSDGVMNPVFVPEAKSKTQRIKSIVFLSLSSITPNGLRALVRILNIVRQIDRRYGWVVALNIAMYLFNYSMFRHAFLADAKVAFTANDFSPVPLAFKAAARANGLKQIFTMHGQISCAESGNIFPSLDCDLSFLYGQKSQDAYIAGSGEPKGYVLFTGFPGESIAMRPLTEKYKTIGVILPNYYDCDTQEKIESLGKLYSKCSLVIRMHPHMAREPKFYGFDNIRISQKNNIKSFAMECDFVLAGNTGAQIDLLKLGCPTMYCPGLDKLGNDDIGLVHAGIILEHGPSAIDATALNAFFNDSWIMKFRAYDSSYLINDIEKSHMQDVLKELYKWIAS